jgi:hypothetical protein
VCIRTATGTTQEGLHYIRKKKKSTMVIKLDLPKAYDKTNWLYLRLILTHVGFNLSVVNWIMGCISSINFLILINGATSEFFKPTRGLRQGCPLSPLFLLVAKGLCRVVMEAKRRGSIEGIKIGSLNRTHPLSVDDILLFINGSEWEARKFQEILNTFCKATGMEINAQK